MNIANQYQFSDKFYECQNTNPTFQNSNESIVYKCIQIHYSEISKNIAGAAQEEADHKISKNNNLVTVENFVSFFYEAFKLELSIICKKALLNPDDEFELDLSSTCLEDLNKKIDQQFQALPQDKQDAFTGNFSERYDKSVYSQVISMNFLGIPPFSVSKLTLTGYLHTLQTPQEKIINFLLEKELIVEMPSTSNQTGYCNIL